MVLDYGADSLIEGLWRHYALLYFSNGDAIRHVQKSH